jgi:hypothetical protein
LRLDVKRLALKGGLGGAVIVPGNSKDSRLLHRVLGLNGERRMPLGGEALTAAEIELIRRWIDEGAAWPEGGQSRISNLESEIPKHWAFVKPERPAPPAVKNAAWVRNPIDRFILARLEREGLKPSPEASKEALIRRVSLDLTGLPPTPREVDDFLADASPDAYEKAVDRLLASPRYGERMAFKWLDAARYADTNGYQSDNERVMWRWRDWVIEAFNQNKPYDQFIVEQLAGDLLPNPTLDQRIATGFNRNHRTNGEDGIIAEEYAVEYAVDRVDTTSTVFLGLTMGCARCHNHKYDPLTQREFYQLFAYFNNVPEHGRANRGGNSPPALPAPTREQQAELARLDRELKEVERRLAGDEARLGHARQRWEKTLTGADAEHAFPEHAFPDQGLLARLSFDEGETAKVTCEQGTLQKAPGRVGQAVKFDGQVALNAGNTGAFRSSDRFTFSAWIYPTSARGGTILARAPGSASQIDRAAGAWMGRGYGLFLDGGKLHFNLVNEWADDAIRVETESTLALNEWHHVLATYDGSSVADGVQVYLDGQPQKLKVNCGQMFDPLTNTEPLRIGAVGESFERKFHGLIDEVRIYKHVLTPGEVAALACADTAREIARLAPAQRTEAQRDKLRRVFLAHAAPAPTRQLWRRLNEWQAARRKLEDSFPTLMVMQERATPRETFLLKRGAYDAPGERVERGVPAIFKESWPPLSAGAANDRLALARWLTAEANPLTARVTVNRFWQMLFGTGLVKTVEDFGAQGERPSHPELLDWLAVEFQRGKWDVKALLKTIVTSATYRQSSRPAPDALRRDPDNRLLSRAPRLRLPAEMIRDQALLVSGLLVEQLGGPSVKPYQPDGLWSDLVNGGKYVTGTGAELYRRSLYTYWKRTIAPPLLQNFDAASREFCAVRETRTNTPLQALNLMNDVTFVEAARLLAERALKEGGKGERDRVRFAFRLATARRPDERETEFLLKQLRAGLAEFARDAAAADRLLQVGEKPRDKTLKVVDVAAYATVASLILNLDEVITKE